jgi:7-carboxy-7-deazaguanine synthase
MRISEIFYTLQGEGVEVGKPAIFVRTSGCNLRCPWCDTKYSWKAGKNYSFADFVDEMTKQGAVSYERVIFTGGEPTLQLKEISEWAKKIKATICAGASIQLETNGTVLFNPYEFDVVAISPKKECVKFNVLRKLMRHQQCFLKFVCENDEDILRWTQLCESLVEDGVRNVWGRVYFMPEGVTNKTLRKRSKWLVERCKEYRVNFSPRLQIWLWGRKRGR